MVQSTDMSISSLVRLEEAINKLQIFQNTVPTQQANPQGVRSTTDEIV